MVKEIDDAAWLLALRYFAAEAWPGFRQPGTTALVRPDPNGTDRQRALDEITNVQFHPPKTGDKSRMDAPDAVGTKAGRDARRHPAE